MRSYQYPSTYNLLIFVFFVIGGIAASVLHMDFPGIKINILAASGIYVFFVPLVLSLILAVTVCGLFLMPLSSFLCGAMVSSLAGNILSSGGNYGDYRSTCAYLCVLVPAFFIVSSGGMYTSGLIREAVIKTKSVNRFSYRAYILSAAAAVAAVCFAGYVIQKI